MINANRNIFIPKQMARVQKQVAAPLKERHGRLGAGHMVAEGSPGRFSAAGGASLDRSPNGGGRGC